MAAENAGYDVQPPDLRGLHCVCNHVRRIKRIIVSAMLQVGR